MKIDKRYLPYVIVLCWFSIGASMGHPITPALIVERGLDSSVFGTAFAAMSISSFCMSPFWGKMCNYWPTKRVTLVCGLGYFMGQTIFGHATTNMMALGGRMFSGFFTGGIYTSFANYVINTSQSPEEQSQMLTLNTTIQNVVGAIGYFVGGMLGTVSIEVTVYGMMFNLFTSAILFYMVCEDDTPYKQIPDHKLTFKEANPFSAILSSREFMTPMLVTIFVTYVFAAIGQTCFEQVFNYYIRDQFGLSSAYNGTFKAVIAICTFICNSTLTMYLIRKTDINMSFVAITLIQILPLGLMLMFNTIVPFAVCDVIFFTLNAVRLPLLQNMVAQRADAEHSNSAMGLYNSMNSFGAIIGALVAGLIYDTNPKLPFMVAFAAFVISGIVALVFSGRYKAEKKASEAK